MDTSFNNKRQRVDDTPSTLVLPDETKNPFSSVDIGGCENDDITSTTEFDVYPRVLFYKGTDVGSDSAILVPFNPHNVVYDDPVKTAFGGCTVNCKYHLKDDKMKIDELIDVVLQTPEMTSNFGLSSKVFDNKRATISIDQSFYGMEQDDEVLSFFRALKLWDALIVDASKKNKGVWFKGAQEIHDDVLQHFYRPITALKYRKTDGKTFSPSLVAKVYKRYGTYEAEVYERKKGSSVAAKQVDMSSIKPGTRLESLIQHNGIWFGVNSFNSVFKLVQATIEATDKIHGYAMVTKV